MGKRKVEEMSQWQRLGREVGANLSRRIINNVCWVLYTGHCLFAFNHDSLRQSVINLHLDEEF